MTQPSYYTFAAEATAKSCATTVDANQGYPAAGVNIGGGVFTPGPFVTETYAQVMQNAASAATEWAYLADEVTTPILTAASAVVGTLPAASATAVTSTWSAVPATAVPTGGSSAV